MKTFLFKGYSPQIASLLIVFCFTNLQNTFAKDENPNQEKSSLIPLASNGKCFDENSHIINLGVGFGNVSKRWGNRRFIYVATPEISLSYEQPWKEKLGPGFLGVGAYVGFQAAREKYEYFHNNSNYYNENKWNYFSLAGRAAYHWDVLNSEKAELYAGVILGLGFQTYSYYSSDPNDRYSNRINEAAIWPAYSVFVGGRYYFSNNIGCFFEAGYGISFARAGLSFKM